MPIYEVSLTIVDGDNGRSNVTTYANSPDVATATTRAQEFAGLIDDFILGKVESIRLNIPITTTGLGLKTTPDPTSDKEIKAKFIFSSVVDKVKPRLSIPTFDKDTYSIAGGDIPFDLASGSPTPIDLFLIALTGGNYADYRGALIDGVLEANESFE